MPLRSVNLDDFMTGLVAGLASAGIRSVGIAETAFDAAVEAAFHELENTREDHGVRLKFWIARNPVYQDYADVREGIVRAAHRDLVSFDSPRNDVMRLRIAAENSGSYLARLPGGPEPYHRITKAFLAMSPDVTVSQHPTQPGPLKVSELRDNEVPKPPE